MTSTHLRQTREQISGEEVVTTSFLDLAPEVPALLADLGAVDVTPIPQLEQIVFHIALKAPVVLVPAGAQEAHLVISVGTGLVLMSGLNIYLTPRPTSGAMHLQGRISARLDSQVLPERFHTADHIRKQLRDFARLAASGIRVS